MPFIKNCRFFGRVAAFAVVTLCYWISFEVEAFVRRKSPRIDVINKWVPRWARINLWLFGIQVEARGAHVGQGDLYPGGTNNVGRIFVANHCSGMDIPILLATAEAHVISRHDLATWPLIGRSARRVGTLFVDRASRRSGASVLKEVDSALQRGEGVAMFPEGTAYVGDQVHKFRPGAFNAAKRAGAEVVPIGLAYGSDDAYYNVESFMSHIRRIASLPRLQVAIEVGQPLSSAQYAGVEMKDVAQAQVQQLVEQARLRLNGSESSFPPTAATDGGLSTH
ncbi:MAG: 1-acyl-sn-glycerol-3-phosphate acyltransferase [Pirellulales bacterium]|nr:1-acyl-sn-glycerol-3-phosphate acyltransferase [Pirellulales bacterium]